MVIIYTIKIQYIQHHTLQIYTEFVCAVSCGQKMKVKTSSGNERDMNKVLCDIVAT